MRTFIFLRKVNWKVLGPAIFLSLLGLLSIYSSSIFRGSFLGFYKQLIFLIASIGLAVLVSLLDLRPLKNNSRLILALYGLGLIFILGLFFFGQEIRGVRGWYKLGPISFDPVPFTAIILLIVLAKFFSVRWRYLHDYRTILFSVIYLFFPVFLILLQPDLGSALILTAVWLGMVVFSGIKFSHLLILVLVFLLLFAVSWQFLLKDYHKARILSFFNPSIDKQGISWSVNQSKIAIGNGGVFGQGLGKGSQTQYGFLSEPKTDFIFSAIAEEFGLLSVFLLFAGLFFLFWQIIRLGFLAENNFSKLFALGFAFLILAQSFINIGMCLGFLPVIGLPLPLVSYGGSYLLAFYFGLGVLLSLTKKP